jgi:hypothetical protein
MTELTQVNSDFFFLDFLWSFFFNLSFCIKLFSLVLCQFSLFLLFGYSESKLVKLTQICLKVFLTFFFYWTLVFFLTRSSFLIFFYLDLISPIVGSSSYPELTQVFCFDVVFSEVFLFIFDIRLLGLKLYNFLSFFFCGFFWFHISGRVLVNLTWVVSDYHCLNILF